MTLLAEERAFLVISCTIRHVANRDGAQGTVAARRR